MRSLDEIAELGSQAVEKLRQAARWADRKLVYGGPALLDLGSTPARVKHQILHDLDKMARWMLLYPYWTQRVGPMIVAASKTRHGKPVRVLDVGVGRGRFLARLESWARKRRIPIDLHGIDLDPGTIATAQRDAREEGRRIDLRVVDARALDFETASMDVVLSTFVLHHLAPGDAARVLSEVDRVAAGDMFVFDIRRSLPVLPVFWAFLRAAAFEAPTRFDSMASLRKGYTVPEIHALLGAAGIERFAVTPFRGAYYGISRS